MNISVRIKCQTCAVRASGLCSDVSEKAANDIGRVVHRRRVPAGQILYGGTPKPKSFGIIVSGVVKLVHSQPDGRNQIVGLQFASDFVGRPFANDGNLLAEAATDLDLCSFSGAAFEALTSQYPDVERAVLRRTLADLDTARDWMFMLGRQTAQERVASLLVLFARRMETSCCAGPARSETGPVAFDMPLSRTDFAACLGLRLETVSRQITLLKSKGIIATGAARHMEVREMAALKQLSETSVD